MLTVALYAFAALGAAALMCSVWLVAILWWVASGEPDVNGDPERDAGVDWKSTDPELVQAVKRFTGEER